MVLDGVTIRDCMVKDLALIQEIENASFDDPYPLSLFHYFLKRFPRGFRVASLEETLVGYCVVVLEHRKALIASLAVNPSYRGGRVGKRLLQDAIDLCKT
ncbi:MAG: GNAT family N-acetyltransferase, partial [Nitrososphaerales archaeon]